MIKTILYDLDGVLVDACEWHRKALNDALFATSGIKINIEDHQKIFNGLPTKKKLEILNKKNLIKKDDFEKIWSLKQQKTVDVIEKMAKLDGEKIGLHYLIRKREIAIGCVTNSIRKTANLMLSKTGQIEFMDFVVSNEDVINNKPHPEPYIKALVLSRSLPAETLIVEDSDKGYQPALLTGCHVLRVNNASEVNISKIFEKINEINGELNEHSNTDGR